MPMFWFQSRYCCACDQSYKVIYDLNLQLLSRTYKKIAYMMAVEW